MNSSTPESYCRAKIASAGTSFYYSTLYYPANIKRELNALHAFHHEIGQIIEECSDPGVAHMKLAWWQEEIQRLYSDAARHPVSRELSQLISHREINEHLMLDIIRHYEKRIHPVWPDSWQGIMEYLAQGPGIVWKFSAGICGYNNQHTPEIVCRMGCLFEMFYLLQDRRIHQQLRPGQPPEYLRLLIDEIKSCYGEIAATDRKPQAGALIMANIVTQTANEIAYDDHNLAKQKTSLTPLRKFWIAWRTHRKVLRTE